MVIISSAYKIMSLILILFLLTSCSTNTETIEYSKLEEEYNKLQNDYQISIKEKQELENKYNDNIIAFNKLKEDYDLLLYYDSIKTDIIEKNSSEVKYLYEKVKNPKENKDSTILNMYNVALINEGDSIGDFQVASLTKRNVFEGLNSYSVAFEGEFVVEGKIFYGVHDIAIGLHLSKDEVKKIPHTYYQRENGFNFNFDASSEEFISAINKKYPNIKTVDELNDYLQQNNQGIVMKAKFDNLSVNYSVNTYISNHADLIEVIEIK